MMLRPWRLAAWLLAAYGVAAHAHTAVDKASPTNGAVLAVSPSEIRLRFNEAVEPAFTSIKVSGASGSAIATDKMQLVDAQTAVLALPVLAAGSYKAQWTAVGHDGHRSHGEIAFSVK